GIRAVKICACGTSYHAGLTGAYLLERMAKIPCQVEIASEFRYKEPLLTPDTLFITISQSGETADTLEALKMAKRAGLRSLTICNVDNSSIVRESDAAILTRAGIEKGVASTKAFATQVMVLWMLTLYLGEKRGTLDTETLQKELDAMRRTPKALLVEEKLHERIHRLSKRYLHGHGFFFIGRDLFFPLALEGALKLKEISYLHAEGYPAGEMKHGPIALADAELFTIALMPRTLLYDKIKSNVEELSARDATILAISPEEFDLADDFIRIRHAEHPMLEFFEMMVVTQLLALEISIRLGNDVDMPRNLAKSVTVE
uniref:glutamine--fructose-6-phosphate transaminase (isomerizing) n=1 Tax=Nitratifractor sp. TaxID=2268144 RepID=UPI0025DE9F8D